MPFSIPSFVYVPMHWLFTSACALCTVQVIGTLPYMLMILSFLKPMYAISVGHFESRHSLWDWVRRGRVSGRHVTETGPENGDGRTSERVSPGNKARVIISQVPNSNVNKPFSLSLPLSLPACLLADSGEFSGGTWRPIGLDRAGCVSGAVHGTNLPGGPNSEEGDHQQCVQWVVLHYVPSE